MQHQSLAAISPLSNWKGEGRSGVTLICFSHLRWDFVFQRRQHLMSRFAREHCVVFWEEPRRVDGLAAPELAVGLCRDSGVVVATPELPAAMDPRDECAALRTLLDMLMARAAGERAKYTSPRSSVKGGGAGGWGRNVASAQRK